MNSCKSWFYVYVITRLFFKLFLWKLSHFYLISQSRIGQCCTPTPPPVATSLKFILIPASPTIWVYSKSGKGTYRLSMYSLTSVYSISVGELSVDISHRSDSSLSFRRNEHVILEFITMPLCQKQIYFTQFSIGGSRISKNCRKVECAIHRAKVVLYVGERTKMSRIFSECIKYFRHGHVRKKPIEFVILCRF